MIAIPARIRNDEVLLTTIFGRCEQIALIDEKGHVEVEENQFSGGVDLANWLVKQGVTRLVMRNMGANPYLTLRQGGVSVYVTPKNKAPIKEIVEDLESGKLLEVTPENMSDYLKAGQHRTRARARARARAWTWPRTWPKALMFSSTHCASMKRKKNVPIWQC